MFEGCQNLHYINCRAEDNTNYTSLLYGLSDFGFLQSPKPSLWKNETLVSNKKWSVSNDLPLTLEATQDGTITINNPEEFNDLKCLMNILLLYLNFYNILNLILRLMD